MYLENPKGLWMGISLILLVLLYLLRPKSKEVLFTSLMFLDEQKKEVHKKLFGAINKNIFFYLQFFALALLVLSASNPIIEKLNEEEKEKQIMIIDLSASTSIQDVFEKLINAAKKNLGKTNTLIIAENVPILLAEEKNLQESKEYLNELTPKYTRNNLRGALSYAISLSSEKNYKKIILISDFLTKEAFEELYDSAKKKGVEIKSIKIENKRKNSGIISVIKKSDGIDVVVKNYGDSREVREIITNEEKFEIELGPKEKKTFSLVKTTEKIEIHPKDEFSADDVVFISQDKSERNKVVIISDSRNKNLEAALEANNFEVMHEKPPIVNLNADVIIFDNADYDRLIFGTFEEAGKKAEEGVQVVFNFAEKMPATELLPVRIKSIETEQEANIEFDKEIFDDLTAKITKKYNVEIKKDAKIIAKDDKANPIIAYKKEGRGIIVYNGISKEYLENSPSYPLFWRAILKIAGKESREKMYKTGEVLRLDKRTKIKTPTSETTTDSILLDEIGIYEIDGEKIQVNLLSGDESDFESENFVADLKSNKTLEEIAELEKNIKKIRIEKSFLLIAVSVLLLELYFAFKRGII